MKPALLCPYVPAGTELDLFEGKAFVSLVGFLFQNTRILGLLPIWPIQNFEEINLRFYIKKKVGRETRRAVCFIKEIVPSRLISWAARVLYNEPYTTFPTRHRFSLKKGSKGSRGGIFSYEWKTGGRWIGFALKTGMELRRFKRNSLEEFILEHYWGYTRQKDGSTKEYGVNHVPWRVSNGKKIFVDRKLANFYGKDFSKVLKRKSNSVFLAEGSNVSVFSGSEVSRPVMH